MGNRNDQVVLNCGRKDPKQGVVDVLSDDTADHHQMVVAELRSALTSHDQGL